MRMTRLIAANNGFHTSHVSEFNFISRPWSVDSLLHPSKYAVVSKPNGEVLRVDYDSLAEYEAHKATIVRSVAKQHSQQGKRVGCNCTFCQMEH